MRPLFVVCFVCFAACLRLAMAPACPPDLAWGLARAPACPPGSVYWAHDGLECCQQCEPDCARAGPVTRFDCLGNHLEVDTRAIACAACPGSPGAA
jgi:hypothetical protein